MIPTAARVIEWPRSGAFTMRPGELAISPSREHKLFFCTGGCRQVLAIDDNPISCYQPLSLENPIECPNRTTCPQTYWVRDGKAFE